MRKTIFCVGDSRTGTMSLHRFLQALGFRSIHNPVKAAAQTLPLHENHTSNWLNFASFIDTEQYDAFSDYPTRYFYKELIEKYPKALFLLTTRKDLSTWQASMSKYFGQFAQEIDMEELSLIHTSINEDIRRRFEHDPNRFLEIDIDADTELNSQLIKTFVQVESRLTLGWENKSAVDRTGIWSERIVLFDTESSDFLRYIEAACAPSKTMLSEFGWMFLVNDANEFLHFQFGKREWGPRELHAATKALKDYSEGLSKRGLTHLHFVIPEKSVVYAEFLPRRILREAASDKRPALLLCREKLEFFYYLGDHLIDAKSHGQLFFKGDNRNTWLGTYFAYVYIIERLNRVLWMQKKGTKEPIPLKELTPSLAAYEGDLASQLGSEFREHLVSEWGYIQSPSEYECLVRYSIPKSKIHTQSLPAPQLYSELLGERTFVIKENENPDLPRAVIVGDSISELMIDLLAEHFSRTLFLLRNRLVPEEIIEQERPSIVLRIMAERYLPIYVETHLVGNPRPNQI